MLTIGLILLMIRHGESLCQAHDPSCSTLVGDLLQSGNKHEAQAISLIQHRNNRDKMTDFAGEAPQPVPACSSLLPKAFSALQFVEPDTESAFEDIYQRHTWASGESLSGFGSTFEATTALCDVIVDAVAKVLEEKRNMGEALSMALLDGPSGDWHWMPRCLDRVKSSLPQGATLQYQGVDIAQDAVDLAERQRHKLGNHIGHAVQVLPFKHADLTDISQMTAATGGRKFDLVVCHDALQHNPLEGVRKILDNFNSLGKYLVIDVDTQTEFDNFRDIEAGGVRFINLQKPPFNARPLCMDENFAQNSGSQGSAEGEWFGVYRLPMPWS